MKLSSLNVGGRLVGPGEPAFIIAEAADTHFGDLDVAHDLISRAASAGADAIKFQHHIPREEMLENIPMSSNMKEPLFDFLTKNALSLDQHRILRAHAEAEGIMYLCTPFSKKAAEEIKDLVPAIKIGSGECDDVYILDYVAGLGKPLLVSTGMSSMADVHFIVDFLSARTSNFALLHCVSGYPPELEEQNLDWLGELRALVPSGVIGFSSHTAEIATSIAAVAMGAHIVEKHVSPDGAAPGPDSEVSLSFDELKSLVQGIRSVERARGSKKEVQPSELEIRAWAKRSVVSAVKISAGTEITEDMLCTKRPGTGIPSRHMGDLVGRVAKQDISPNSLLDESMLT